MSEDRLREIEERANKATPGPWVEERTGLQARVYPGKYADMPPESPYGTCGIIPVGIDAICTMQTSNQPNNRHDQAFITHCREDVPYLLEQLRVLARALLDCAKQEVANRHDAFGGCDVTADTLVEMWIEQAEAEAATKGDTDEQ
jgi:hypothetical protein